MKNNLPGRGLTNVEKHWPNRCSDEATGRDNQRMFKSREGPEIFRTLKVAQSALRPNKPPIQ